ncbi:MAG: hypothetical protein GXY38_14310 [Planctomycetes bacterium]|nr:hypothetical protein [Planctomycetota bacterium]
MAKIDVSLSKKVDRLMRLPVPRWPASLGRFVLRRAWQYPDSPSYLAFRELIRRWVFIEYEKVRRCRVCGCSHADACVVDGEPCHWVEKHLCSACGKGKEQ